MKFKLLILFTFVSVVANLHFASLLIGNEMPINGVEVEAEGSKSISTTKLKKAETRKEINRNFFPNTIELKDYSTVKYTLETKGKDLIKSIRELHNTPTLIAKAYRDKDLCSGFIWSLSEEIWGEYIPYYIGMMTPDTKVPAKAWELPYSYKSYGGEILIDFTEKIDLKTFKEEYWDTITKNDLLKFFSLNFSENALLGDIGFLYIDTKYIDGLLTHGFYNSHVVKNMGISEFIKQINFGGNYDNHEFVLQKLFDVKVDDIEKFNDVLSSYKFYLNGTSIVYTSGEFFYLSDGKYIGERVEFKILDYISYNDITVAHYYQKKGRVDSLLNLVLGGEFLPINIMTINNRFIEKM